MDYKRQIAESIEIEGADTQEIYDLLTVPKDNTMGDWCLPCFKFAKAFRKSPMVIAEEIAEKVGKREFLADTRAVAGYVNFTLNKRMFAREALERILDSAERYGDCDEGQGKTVCIDYSSVNIAKPFHMGHMLNTAIGAALYRIYTHLGYKVVGINHLGDWGTQFGKLIVAYKKWGNQADIDKRGVKGLLDIYVRFHKEAESDPSLEDEARYWFKQIEDGNREAQDLWQWFKEITMKEVLKIYDRLNVKFDSFAGESFYNDKMQPVLDELERKGLLEESEGAKIVRLDEEGMPPCLLVRADGATLYATRDMAAAFYRKETYRFDLALYVVAYQQNLHFRQFFKVIEKMGYDWAEDLVHVAHGMVSLEEGSLSTRSGNVVFLEDVLDQAARKALATINEKNPDLEGKEQIAEQVGVGAVIFGMLFNSRIKDMVFSYDKVLNFDGETGPYVQYTYARCNSVLEKGGAPSGETNYEGVDNPEAAELISLLNRYPEILKEAARKFEPCVVTRYAVDVAQSYNKFYYRHKINNAAAPVKNARLRLTAATKQILSNALGVLGIATPAKM